MSESCALYRCQSVFLVLFVSRVLRQLTASGAAAVLLFLRQFLHLFPEKSLEVVLCPGAEQTHSQVGVSKQSRERPSRLQRILRSLLTVVCADTYRQHSIQQHRRRSDSRATSIHSVLTSYSLSWSLILLLTNRESQDKDTNGR